MMWEKETTPMMVRHELPLTVSPNPQRLYFTAHESFNGSQQRIEEPIAAKRTYEPQQVAPPVPADRRHLEDLTNQAPVNNSNYSQNINNNVPKENKAIIIAADSTFDPVST